MVTNGYSVTTTTTVTAKNSCNRREPSIFILSRWMILLSKQMQGNTVQLLCERERAKANVSEPAAATAAIVAITRYSNAQWRRRDQGMGRDREGYGKCNDPKISWYSTRSQVTTLRPTMTTTCWILVSLCLAMFWRNADVVVSSWEHSIRFTGHSMTFEFLLSSRSICEIIIVNSLVFRTKTISLVTM